MLKEDLAKAFHATEAFKWDANAGFRLASGIMSPYYVDCRTLLAHPESRRLVAQLAFERISALEFDSIGGLEIGSIPLATAISDYGYTATPRRLWRTFVVRKQAKEYGLGKTVEGAAKSGDRALVVDDVLTTGGSLIKAAHAAREAGLIVTHALVVVDRNEQDGVQAVEHEGLTLISLLTLGELRSTKERLQ